MRQPRRSWREAGRPRRPGRRFDDALREGAIADLSRAWPDIDWVEIARLSDTPSVLYAESEGDRGVVPLLRPRPTITDQMEFDRRVCAAGLTEFIRGTMPEDNGAGCTPIDPDTGKPDPSITRPLELRFGTYVRVRQLAPGFRTKEPVGVSFLGPKGYKTEHA